MSGTAPAIPDEFQQYNTYVEDPKWQRKFTIIWGSCLALAVAFSLPYLFRSIRNKRAFLWFGGVSEDLKAYTTIPGESEKQTVPSNTGKRRVAGLLSTVGAVALWTPPGIEMNAGQIFVVLVYLIIVLVCIIVDAPLRENSNRAGKDLWRLAQFPVVFLFATKNSLLSLLLGPGHGYEKLNYIHRWASRSAFSVLCIIVLSSFRVVRTGATRLSGFLSFFITVCYHTPYASPWIFPPLAFYGLDIQMTIISIKDCDSGWEAGQHSHPLSILSAPRATTCLSMQGITLGARVRGDWTKAVNVYARESGEKDVQVMLDGPYGGSSIDLGDYESVLLFAGGSGATVTVGLLDDIVGRCVKRGRRNGERTRRVSFVWCVRSFGCIEWFAPMLAEIAAVADASTTLDVHVVVYVTCLCNPEAVPRIANSDVIVGRPAVREALEGLVTPPVGKKVTGADVDVDEDEESAMEESKLGWVGLGGGVGVVASGPESLTREASNAVARLSMARGRELGGVALHTEMFTS
ncbi:hypothetical protein CPB85DRAFT_1375526 [Mucidula mucida]|nr:hypothetical protein CPB85DRAFT_1375526 [Mucidula mucida]